MGKWTETIYRIADTEVPEEVQATDTGVPSELTRGQRKRIDDLKRSISEGLENGSSLSILLLNACECISNLDNDTGFYIDAAKFLNPWQDNK